MKKQINIDNYRTLNEQYYHVPDKDVRLIFYRYFKRPLYDQLRDNTHYILEKYLKTWME